jgi:prepilin peptidase CpaA
VAAAVLGARSMVVPSMLDIITLLALSALLTMAAYSDLRSHRIPNALSLCGVIGGIGLQCVAAGPQGLASGLLGAIVGLACFAPFYLLRAMGAGDVKLLAAAGAFLGPHGAFYAALLSLIAGGLSAYGYVLWRAISASAARVAHGGLASAGAAAFVAVGLARRDRLPFALPIALGGMAVCAYQLEFTGFSAWLNGVIR